ncbi:hypothetical protein [Paraclostridium sordellii]|uniref:hypothetical protein n=1 Tax=Paraclostridium sordellii TaxID=1505 RepID=UPI00189B67BE|nr:hypothetical protein [Paeniclostridium sordellii]
MIFVGYNCSRGDYMDRTMFDELTNEDKIHYINGELLKGKTVIRIREDLHIGEKTFQRLVKDLGYRYNQKLRQYVKQHTDIIQSKEYDIDNTFSIPRFKEEILEILDMKNDLKEIVKSFKEGYYKEHTNVIEVVSEEGIKIELPNSDIVRTTVRVNKDILDKWNLFCEDNKEFSKTNLLSMSMKQYMDKYNKY